VEQLAFPLVLSRRVQLWSYGVSHSVLLFRANRRPGLDSRVDLMFRAVRQMKVNHRYEDLTISVPGPEEAQKQFGLSGGEIEGRIVFELASGGFPSAYVVAGSLYMAEDDLEDGHPSALDDESLAAHIIRSGSHIG
jgi:hypothetical protein